ncbi:MAG TPA: sulfotransferase domain-containing protein [Caulobacter sp.]|nr:sulfotransferase domain-containing protein [Caulobacter sp.]
MNTAFALHCLNRDLTNLALIKHRHWDGYLVTGQHSGTHWIKWMLSWAMAHRYGLEPPRFYNNNSSNAVIGHPKHRLEFKGVPRIASSHSIPAYAVQWGWVRSLAPLPPYGVVMRDLRDVLVSNYEKWKAKYAVPFEVYVEGDPRSKRYVCDVWWYIRFMNRWGEVASRFPAETRVLKYEDFRRDPGGQLDLLAKHLGLDLGPDAIAAGVAAGGKDTMLAHMDPNAPAQAVREDGRGDTVWTPETTARLQAILREHLKHDFGYDFGI